MNKIKDLYNRILHIGYSEDLSYTEKIKVVILNQQVLVFIFFLLFFSIQTLSTREIDAFIPFLLNFFILPVLYFQSKKKYFFARFYAIIVASFLTFLTSLVYGEVLRLEYAFYAYTLSALIYFDKSSHKILIFLYIIVLYLTSFFFFKTYESPFADFVNRWDALVVFIAIEITMATVVLYFYDESQKHYTKKNILANELKERNKRLEELIREDTERNKILSNLVSQNETKAKLLEMLAHDIKGPSHIFKNLTKKISYILAREEPHRIKDLAEDFEQAGINLSFTLENFLNWTVSQKEGIRKNIQRINLAILIREVISDLSYYSDKKIIFIKNRLVKDFFCFTDYHILKIIITNIAHNAIKFSVSGSEIILETKLSDDEIIISIRDYGKGMTDKYIKRVMSNELVTSPGTDYEKGHGLGLKSCFNLVTHLSGKIEIESVKKEGTCFKIYLPNSLDN